MELSNPYSDNADCGALAEFCRKAGRETVYRRHEYFGRRGGPAIFMGYIEEGGVRYAVTDDAGRSHTVGFCCEGDFAADYSAFVQGRPALVDSVAIQDTRMKVITRRQYFDFIGSDYDTCLLGRKMAERLFVSAYDRLLGFYLMNPEQRYVDLMTRYPHLGERLTSREIASLVGIAPETLSRIRRRLLDK